MPSALFKRVDMDSLYPPFLETLLNVVAECRDRYDATYEATSGYRSFSEQMKLYFQGRTGPGPIVTQAKAGESAHNFGLAVDFVRVEDGEVSWREVDYVTLGAVSVSHGLVWGGAFHKPDRPHVQLAGYVTAQDLAPLKAIYEQGGDEPLNAVWAEIERRQNATLA